MWTGCSTKPDECCRLPRSNVRSMKCVPLESRFEIPFQPPTLCCPRPAICKRSVENRARNDLAHDFGAARVDARYTCIGIPPTNLILLHVAGAAVQLHALVQH